jgi:DNA-3-methyladenine glycosylase I
MTKIPNPPPGLSSEPDGKLRCAWHQGHADYRKYHDEEWGRPVTDDTRLFEKICLEGFQAGLSWLTILRKRTNFRKAFAGFDMEQLAQFGPVDVHRLMKNEGIIRHRGKIESAINNAERACDLKEEFGSLSNFFWKFEPPAEERPADYSYSTLSQITTSQASHRLSQELKRRGWRFVGPTTAYAFMQAMGVVNDHLEGCFCRAEVEEERRAML